MANKTLTTNYLSRLSNANHDGVTQQIDDRFAEFETENQLFIAARNAVHQARQAEDTPTPTPTPDPTPTPTPDPSGGGGGDE